MANKIFLDNIDITDALAEQASLDTDGAIVPSGSKWFDLLPVISSNETLKKSFFTSGIHTLAIQNSTGGYTSAKIFIKSKYTARNR